MYIILGSELSFYDYRERIGSTTHKQPWEYFNEGISMKCIPIPGCKACKPAL